MKESTMPVSEKATEAAAEAAHEDEMRRASPYGDGPERTPFYELTFTEQDHYRDIVRPILRAAAPFIAADAWDEGYGVGRNDGWHDARDPEPNPYR